MGLFFLNVKGVVYLVLKKWIICVFDLKSMAESKYTCLWHYKLEIDHPYYGHYIHVRYEKLAHPKRNKRKLTSL